MPDKAVDRRNDRPEDNTQPRSCAGGAVSGAEVEALRSEVERLRAALDERKVMSDTRTQKNDVCGRGSPDITPPRSCAGGAVSKAEVEAGARYLAKRWLGSEYGWRHYEIEACGVLEAATKPTHLLRLRATKKGSSMNKPVEKPSAAQLIQKYIECRNSIAMLTDRHEKEVRPYREGMELIESLLAEEINRLEGQSIKTAHGTAYRSTITSFKVADRETWLSWVFDNNQRDMLTTHVAKDAVKEFMDGKGGTPPPGLNITQIYKINVRSPDNV